MRERKREGEQKADWFDQVPKAELHLHLEGAIGLPALWDIIQAHGGDRAVPDVEALRQRFVYRDLAHFLETWSWKNRFLRTYGDFAYAAEAVARDLVAQNIRYAELFYSPADFRQHGLTATRLTAAIRQGLRRVERAGGVEVSLVADLVRDYGPDAAWETLHEVAEVADQGVVGVGIGGTERRFPPEPFAAVYERARQLGFRTSAHAGEAAGPPSVWGALEVLRVDRLGHGTRAVEDPALVERLAASGVTVECCPLSNLRTGVVPSLAEHPIQRLRHQGVSVTVSTDDPVMFGHTLAEEYRQLQMSHGLTRDELRDLVLESVRAAWLPAPRRAQLEAAFVADPAW